MEPLAEKIRSDTSIQGIIAHKHQHTISLFADDVILSLSNPATSLPAAHDVLQLFSKVSYYKVNSTKSNMLGIHMDKNLEISGNEFSHTKESITYLGIKLTSPLTNLYHINYTTPH